MSRFRLRAWLLWLSLALNMFLLALIGVNAVFYYPHHQVFGDILATLDADDAARFRNTLRDGQGVAASDHAAIMAAKAQLAAAIEKTPYDADAVADSLDAMRHAWNEHVTHLNHALLAGLGQLSDVGRARFAAAARQDGHSYHELLPAGRD